ncbi:MAG: energy transducer TonB, partial [Myxococcales bacterium]|nr:energy transducer TonB [Myxococcales bacterium]
GQQAATAPPGGGTVGGAPAPADYRALLPTLGPEDLMAHDGSIDHLEDVESGDHTFLNTREHKYAWFFNRVKSSVQQRWHAVEAHRRYDPYGRVYGVRDRLTVVEVTLNADGSLDDIFVKKDSGVGFLDDAALQAFRDASPFPNPPSGLRDDDGRIRFSFGFYLEIDGRGFRMFRY